MADTNYKVADNELEGAIFDCDGTLVDTMPAYWDSWKETCDHFGLDFSEERFYSLAGVPVRDIFIMLIRECKASVKPDIDVVCAHKMKLGKLAMARIGAPKIPAVVAIAESYKAKGIPCAVASSGYRSHVMHSLESEGLMSLFDAVVTVEDIVNPKPAPDIFLLAAKKLGVNPRKCRGYEDADAGMLSLQAAGMEAIDVRKMPSYPRRAFEIAREAKGLHTPAVDTSAKFRNDDLEEEEEEEEENETWGEYFRDWVWDWAPWVLFIAFLYQLYVQVMSEAIKEEALEE